MKSFWRSNMISIIKTNVAVLLTLFAVLFFVACSSDKKDKHSEREVDEYTCSMHPQIVQNKPGTCPICGMELVKKSTGNKELVISEELKELIKPTNSSVVATIKTTHPERKTLIVTASASGSVNYDTRKTYSVPVRFGGRIEKLFLKYNYQPVKRGQVIMEIYSPELLTAQRELLYIVQQQKNDKQLVGSAKQKLLLLGLTAEQIEKVIAAGKETFAFPVLSPYTGYIVESAFTTTELPALAQPTSRGSTEATKGMLPAAAMGASLSAPSAGEQISAREGMYVSTGQSVFKVIDAAQLWVELYFTPSEGRLVQQGDQLHLEMNGLDETILARADFIQPFFTEGKQFLQVRSYLKNSSKAIRVGQLVTGKISQTRTQALWIPKNAVLDLGVRQIVFLKMKGAFLPFNVKTGWQTDGWVEVIEGIDESSEIAINAQYLVDSESFIKMMNP